MYSFAIVGASRETGAAVEFTVKAANEVDARMQASEMGYVVSSISPVLVEHATPASPAAVAEVKHEGPPVNCRWCGGKLKRKQKSTGNGMGCILVLVGLGMLVALCVFPLNLLGVPVLLWGVYIGTKVERQWQCKSCHELFPRR